MGMREWSYEIDEDGAKGFVKVKVPNYLDRMKRSTELSASLEADRSKAIDVIYGLVKEHVVEIDVELNGEKITDLDTLSDYRVGYDAINELGEVLTKGIPLARSKPHSQSKPESATQAGEP